MNGKEHRQFGAVAGAGSAGVTVARRIVSKHGRGERFDWVDLISALVHLFGGAVGGKVGSILPDRIDPPTSPRHRSVGHSVALAVPATAGLTVAAHKAFDRVEPTLERRREALRKSVAEGDVWQSIKNGVALFFSELFTGFISALPIGYASHLAGDSRTTMGLPLLTGG